MLNKNYSWYLNASLDKYAGKWVVIVNNSVVAAGKNIKALLERVMKKYPGSRPFVAKVPDRETLVL